MRTVSLNDYLVPQYRNFSGQNASSLVNPSYLVGQYMINLVLNTEYGVLVRVVLFSPLKFKALSPTRTP